MKLQQHVEFLWFGRFLFVFAIFLLGPLLLFLLFLGGLAVLVFKDEFAKWQAVVQYLHC